MSGGNEQRVAINFCFKTGLSAYGNEVLNRLNVFRWYSPFRDGRERVEDDERGGRPKLTGTEVNIAAAVVDLVKNDRRIASRIIAKSLNINPYTLARFSPASRSQHQPEGWGTSSAISQLGQRNVKL
jgi:hypothetical protein